ncbi:CRISPR system precrRNA processing endoribonuclease RAMP protein Cas6 [Haladaptatus cibarius]|uniref:CRISPR system precrRNA processing endoribonuclease RAMP protein Cas6 n=1 Tax=Haladaptatus cibarius TaxID=453847 RepID=UPI000678E6E3|nr:CRISPR system precrRNA processing endoribonuclease RAMP protein Cas6 [Haladaptatus cibarius]
MSQTTPTPTTGTHRLRRITLTVRPTETFPVPISDGYSVYSALLAALNDVDAAVSEHIHDSPLGSLHSSGLLGVFGNSNRDYHKTVRSDRSYELSLGIVDSRDDDIFQSLVSALVLDGNELELTNGTLHVEIFESENTSHEALLAQASEYDNPSIEMEFRTPTCIEEAGDVTTMFPHRRAVFQSLCGKWNRTAPDEHELAIDDEDVLAHIIEKPDARAYDTHSVLVNRIRTEDDESRAIFRQGFTGRCEYALKDASESVQNAVVALALFGEYSGVGSAVARGCGNVQVNL